LKEKFSKYGTIKSLVLCHDEKANAPFGFVCFEDPSDPTKGQ